MQSINTHSHNQKRPILEINLFLLCERAALLCFNEWRLQYDSNPMVIGQKIYAA